MPSTPELDNQIELLRKKYQAMGQDLNSYLEGLLHSDYLTYWDYIHIDTLLSLQTPRTSFPDEEIFIIYHQITELYFKLCLNEMRQISEHASIDKDFFVERIRRINSYFTNLTHSFEIMIDGMEREQFLKFRMALLPASGFQSGQYRMIEIGATDLINLVAKDVRPELEKKKNLTSAEMMENIYWGRGATELASGKKTLTLKQFEQKYVPTFTALADKLKQSNLWQVYMKMPENLRKDEAVVNSLKHLDVNVNINWPLVHYKSAARYLQKDPEDIKATGCTNLQKYLPPRFKKRIFYPLLWTEEEKENWGKGWVDVNVFNIQN